MTSTIPQNNLLNCFSALLSEKRPPQNFKIKYYVSPIYWYLLKNIEQCSGKMKLIWVL